MMYIIPWRVFNQSSFRNQCSVARGSGGLSANLNSLQPSTFNLDPPLKVR